MDIYKIIWGQEEGRVWEIRQTLTTLFMRMRKYDPGVRALEIAGSIGCLIRTLSITWVSRSLALSADTTGQNLMVTWCYDSAGCKDELSKSVVFQGTGTNPQRFEAGSRISCSCRWIFCSILDIQWLENWRARKTPQWGASWGLQLLHAAHRGCNEIMVGLNFVSHRSCKSYFAGHTHGLMPHDTNTHRFSCCIKQRCF